MVTSRADVILAASAGARPQAERIFIRSNIICAAYRTVGGTAMKM